MKDDSGKISEKLMTDSIIIALFPVLAYLFTYTYEIAYAQYFSIPVELVEIDLMTTLKFVNRLAFPAFVVLLAFNLFMALFHGVNNPIVQDLKHRGPFYIYSIALIVISIRVKELVVPFVATFTAINAIHFLSPLIHHRGKGTYCDKFKAQSEIEERGFKLYSYLGQYPSLLLMIIMLGSMFSYQCGKAQAIEKEVFQLVGNSSTVMLCKYGESIICADYNDRDFTISNRINIINTSEIENISIETKHIGRLKVDTK